MPMQPSTQRMTVVCTCDYKILHVHVSVHCQFLTSPNTHRLKPVDQVPPPLVICLDDTCYTKVSHGPVCFPHPGAGSEKKFQ